MNHEPDRGQEPAADTLEPMDDQAWFLRASVCLAMSDLDDEEVEAVLQECRDHLSDSGQRAVDAFGSPSDFAREASAARVGEQRGSAMNPYGEEPGLVWRQLPARFGVRTLLGAVVVLLVQGWTTTVTARGLALVAAAAALTVLAAWSTELVNAGRLPGARVVMAAGAVVTALAMVGWIVLPATPLLTVPTWLVGLAGLVAALAGVLLRNRLVEGARRRRRVEEATERHADPARPDATPLDDATWERRLVGLLRGRHEWSRGDAQEVADQCRAHVAGTGLSAHEEYGEPDVFARRMAQGSPERRRAFPHRSQLRLAVLAAVAMVAAVVAQQGEARLLVVLAVWLLGCFALALLVLAFVARMRAGRTAS